MASYRYHETNIAGFVDNYNKPSNVIHRPMKIPQLSVDLLKIGRDVEFEKQLGLRKKMKWNTSASRERELKDEIKESCELMVSYDNLMRKLLKDGDQ